MLRPLAIAVGLMGCAPSPESGPDPCNADPLGCGMGEAFQIDDSCTNSEPLEVEMGEDAAEGSGFAALSEGLAPTVHYGLQGGQHVEMAFRVLNPDPEHRAFQAVFTIELEESGIEPLERSLVAEDALTTAADGALELSGIVIFVTPDVEMFDGRVILNVTDSCGREAQATHAFLAP